VLLPLQIYKKKTQKERGGDQKPDQGRRGDLGWLDWQGKKREGHWRRGGKWWDGPGSRKKKGAPKNVGTKETCGYSW